MGDSAVDEIESEIKAQFDKVKDANMKIIQALNGRDAETEVVWLVDVRKQYQTAMGIITRLKDMNCEKKVGSSAESKGKGCNQCQPSVETYKTTHVSRITLKNMSFLPLKTPMRLHMC